MFTQLRERERERIFKSTVESAVRISHCKAAGFLSFDLLEIRQEKACWKTCCGYNGAPAGDRTESLRILACL